MNFFHLSDLHIGLKLLNRDMREDQEYILKQIADLAGEKQPDAVVIAGDIYDKAVPSAEAVEVFDKFISRLNEAAPRAEIMIVSGNHDSGTRVNLFRSVLQRHKIHMIGLPPQTPEEYIEKVTMPDEFGNVNFYLLPFVKPSMLKAIVGTDESGNNLTYDETLRRLLQRENINTRERNVLVSHQFYLPAGTDPDEVERMDSEIVTVGNVDEVCADVLQPFDYAALGHIHKPMQVGSDRFRYCGTPLPLTPLRQVRVIRGDLEEVLQQGSDDYVTVVLTDKRDYDVIDMKDRLYLAFPNLLEIRRDVQRTVDYSLRREAAEKLAPFDLCNAFLKDLDEEEKMILRDVINAAQNGEGKA